MANDIQRSEFTKGDSFKTPSRESEMVGLCREARRGGVTRRQFVERLLGLGLTASAAGALLAACGPEPASDTTSEPDIGPTTMPESISFYNWSDYMDPALKKRFEKETGTRVAETYFDDNEALLAKLKAGATGYDVIVPSDYMCHIMIMSEMLEPLDMDYIPNFKNVESKFVNPVYDDPAENGGNQFSVPYQWGTTGIGVRLDKAPRPIARWADLWDPAFKGQINMLNDERETPMAALKMLGYSLNTTDQGQLDEATAKLIEQKPMVRQYDSINMKRALVEGMPLVQTWNGDCLQALDALEPEQLAYILPEEGYTVWVDVMAIPTGYRSMFGAHTWMNWLLEPKTAAQLADWVWFLTPVPEAKAYQDEFALSYFPTDADLQRGEVTSDVGEFARSYTDAWAKVKSS